MEATTTKVHPFFHKTQKLSLARVNMYTSTNEATTLQQPDVITFDSSTAWLPVELDASTLRRATFLDFSFYPVKHAIVDDVLAPICNDIERDLIGLPDTDDLSRCKDFRDDIFVAKDPETCVSSTSWSILIQKKREKEPTRLYAETTEPCSQEAGGEHQQRFKPFHEEKWALRYKELLQFYGTHGHAAVPHTYPRNPQLARWVKRQRRQYKLLQESKTSTMTSERLQLLGDLGFIWDSHEVNWREKLESLRNFRQVNGHSNVPSNHWDNKLATWVKCQRRQHKLCNNGKQSAMTPERMTELEEAGFEWEIRTTSPRKKS
jgi:hypothetical protein